MNTLNEALYRLLFHKKYRDLFLSEKYMDLNLKHEDLKAIQTIDKQELEQTSNKLCLNILNGNSEVEGGIKKAYADTFQKLKSIYFSEYDLAYEFLASPSFSLYKELPYTGKGICLEEAFFLFLSTQMKWSENEHDRLLLLHEYLTVMFSILTVNKNPNFEIKSEYIKFNGDVWYTVITYPKTFLNEIKPEIKTITQDNIYWLYASSLKDSFISGPVSKLIASLISKEDIDNMNIQEFSLPKFKFTQVELQDCKTKLETLGLIK